MGWENEEVFLICKLILERLNNMSKWGGAHSELKRVLKSLPSHLSNSNQGKKQINKAVKYLTNRRYLLSKPSTGEIHVSLNPRMTKEIRRFIDEHKAITTKYKE